MPIDGDVYVFPMSFAQQRLWFLDQLAPANAFYNLPAAMRLAGDIRVPTLEAALNEIIRRHESLRTVFAVQEGRPVQLVLPELMIQVPVIDLCHLQPTDREAEARRRASEEARRPFDLAEGPLIRAQVLRLDASDHVLLLTLHHIVGDGWSMNVLFEELTTAYAALAAGRPAALPDLPIQYADFAVWQREWLRGEVLEAQLAYWEGHLAGAPVLELPGDRARPRIKTYQGSQHVITLSAGLTEGISLVSREAGVTTFMVALAAFKVLLHRYTGETDIAVGSPIANRNRAETERLIGFFVNTLVIRTGLEGDPTFRELLGRVRESTLGAYAHQDLPFEMVVERLQPDRDLGRNPLFQVIFQLFENPIAGRQHGASPGLPTLDAHTGTAKFDLEVSLFHAGPVVTAKFEYSADVFEPATIARLADHFEQLLESVVADPLRRISELPMLSPAEARTLAVDWNRTSTSYPRDATVVELFEQQARQSPDAVAALFSEQSITFAELDRRTNQLAHALVRRGVEPRAIVGVCVDRSVDMLVGVLGTLKAGAAYLPLDPSYPAERLAFMLEDAGCKVLLTQQHLEGGVPNALHGRLSTLCLDKDWSAIGTEPTSSCGRKVDSDSLAYVMYTSGSTGEPKGTCIPHRGIVRLVRNTDYVELGPDDRIAQMSNFSFDAATFEIWGALLNGGCAVGIPREVVLSPAALAAALRLHRITTAFVTTSLFNQIANEKPDTFATLTHLLFGGSAVDPRPVREVLERAAPKRLLHVYGPTENTTFTTWQLVTGVPADAVTVPIGRPIANTQVYVLDRHRQPVPVDVPGELYIGGDGLAAGYLNRPELTNERFVPNPFSPDPQARLYRTGDLVRWRGGGIIEFLRRLDDQVKVRGFRVEPAEIEAVLLRHPGVREAVVVPRHHPTGGTRLVAYIVPGSTEIDDQAARDASDARVSEWQHIYDRIIYNGVADSGHDGTGPAFVTTGWNSSYTGLPIQSEHMAEQVAGTVGRVLEHRPSRVLEIGTGTGLLLFRIAPQCGLYCATDFSCVVLDFLRERIGRNGQLAERVRLLQRRADDFSGFAAGEFDTVVLNSVVQYFPTAAALATVIRGALDVLAPGGRIFIGDVRNLRLLEALHASIELERAPDLSVGEIRDRVRTRVADEHELVLDPLFFSAEGSGASRVTAVEVQLKRGWATNELSMFRYDVVLYTGGAPVAAAHEIDWDEDRLTVGRLAECLTASPESLLVRNVSNARILDHVERCARLFSAPDLRPAAEIALHKSGRTGVHPEQLWKLAGEESRRASICWSKNRPDAFDVEFSPRGLTERVVPGIASCTAVPSSSLANDPLKAFTAKRLVPEVRGYVKERVPEYMVPSAVVVVERLPLTPNGKVDRGALPAPEGVRPELGTAYAAPATAAEAALAGIWSEVLGVERVGVADNFFELGGDSILSIQIVARARQAGWVVTPQQMFQQQTVRELAAVAVASGGEGAAEEGPVTGAVPLLPVQAWFFEQGFADAHHFNQAVLVPVGTGVPLAWLRAALGAVVAQHDALRLRFAPTPGGWESWCEAAVAVACEEVDLTAQPGPAQRTALETTVARVQGSLDLTAGPLMRVALIRLGGGAADRLLWVVHHLAVDGVSWRILLDDLQTALGQQGRGEAVRLPARTTSVRRWAERLQAYAAAADAAEVAYWQAQQRADAALPRDLEGGANTVAAEQTWVGMLSEAETRAVLQEVPALWHTQINDALLTALLEAWAAWTGREALRLDLEGHGREDLFAGVDVSRTVGWLTSIFPVWLRRETPGDLAATLRSVKEQLRRVPARGLGYGVLRYLGPAAVREALTGPPAAISMNYLGQLSPGRPGAAEDAAGEEGPATWSAGPVRSRRAHRAYLLEINAAVLAGRLRVHWTYSTHAHTAATIARLGTAFLDTLRALIRLARTTATPGYTPSDFPQARLDQRNLDKLFSRLNRARSRTDERPDKPAAD
jgi:amino acid adenylation domain-containing protein/non-ribosomal peptide synthase protein (TIGR01720 family)